MVLWRTGSNAWVMAAAGVGEKTGERGIGGERARERGRERERGERERERERERGKGVRVREREGGKKDQRGSGEEEELRYDLR